MRCRVNSFVTTVALPLTVLAVIVGAIGCQSGVSEQPRHIAAPLPLRRPDACTRPKLIVFYATWCGPCQSAKPFVTQIEAAGVEVVRYDIDAQPEMARKYGVTSVPTFFICQCGKGDQRTQDIGEVLAIFRPFLHCDK